MTKKWFLWGFFYAISLVFSVQAAETPHSRTKLEVYTSTQNISQDSPLQILVKITPQNGWHLYWDNPGDTGLPTKVQITSDRASVSLKEHSVPKYFYLHHLITQYAYDTSAYWLFDVHFDKKPTENEAISFQIEGSWMACQDECLTEKLSQNLSLAVTSHSFPDKLWEQELFNAQKTFPQKGKTAYYHREKNSLRISVSEFNDTPETLHFIPYIRDLVDTHQPINFISQKGRLFADIPLYEDAVLPKNFQAILLFSDEAHHLSLTPQFIAPILVERYSLMLILLMAFGGGLILNLMPCIFPILFLKMMNLINSAYSVKKVSLEAVLYFCGVMTSFALISSLLWFMRRSGEMIGWGFQLQSSGFVLFLCLLFLVLGFMFLDVLQFNLPIFNRLATLSFKNHKLNAFLTGLFAVLIASPCSAPFMGAAIGYSITQPVLIYFSIFTALAVGYALPFTLLGLFPQYIAKILPRPGKWMMTLKKIFSIPIFLTALWLGWVFYNQMTISSPADDKSDLVWQEFSEAEILKLQQNKQPLFIDFTAKWCLTCLVNEKTALSSQTFKDLVSKKKITLFKADWTTQNDDITNALMSYGRNSVPLYIYYSGQDDKPVILPQLLTSEIIKECLD